MINTVAKWFKDAETNQQESVKMVIEKDLKTQEFSITYDGVEVGKIIFIGGKWFFHTCPFCEANSIEQRTHLFTIDELDMISIELSKLSQKHPGGIEC